MKRLFFLMIVFFAVSARATEWQESPKVEDLFKASKATGVFVLYDLDSDRWIGFDQTRAHTRFVPASTFKIPNSLIGLSVGVVKDVDQVIPYTGPKEPFIKEWARDMGLRDALVMSNLHIYQELARRIGLEKMAEQVARMNYGNKEIGSAVDRFWLEGPLKISAVEQTRFLADLAQGKLPLPAGVQQQVREITLIEKGETWELHGKTGWENAPGAGVGWWVGWVKTDGRIYSFALNIDMQTSTDAPKRIELGRASLEALGILPTKEKKTR